MTVNNTPQKIIKELNLIVLDAAREVAKMEDGHHQLAIKFGLSRKTAEAIESLTCGEIVEIAEKMSGSFIFSTRNFDSQLFSLIRNKVPESDVSLLARMRFVAASKVGVA